MNQRETIIRPVPTASPSARPAQSRCRVAPDWLSGSQYRGELCDLLHRRLRVVSLLALAPLGIFFVRNLLEPNLIFGSGLVPLTLHALVVVILSSLAILLWSRRNLSFCELRSLELFEFGSLALFFGWLQFNLFSNHNLFDAAACDDKLEVVRVWIDYSATRWFFLIVIYGVFIPNTWKRCALVAGGIAIFPLVLTPLSAWWNQRFEIEVALGLFDFIVLMGTALATGVYGSYRLQMLQEEAFQAKQLGQYRLGEKLGAGGMGEVYKAEHVLLRRPCALKLIHPAQTQDPAALLRFEREVQAMAGLTHPNTVEIYDYGSADDGTFYYVMEYLPGQNLETLVTRNGPMPAGRVIHFLQQVCSALREAHKAGLLHRDIKPSNIIACERGGIYDVVKLLDFGLVQDTGLGKEASRITLQGTVLGSPPFMSPEQAAGRTDLDVRADIYSVGGVGYYLLTGQPPFQRETPMEMLLAHAYEPLVPPSQLQSGIPGDLEGIIIRCLNKKPEQRFSSIAVLERALNSCADAGTWTGEIAEQWWRDKDLETDTQSMPATPTPLSVTG